MAALTAIVGAANAAQAVGAVEFLSGQALVSRSGESLPLRRGAEIFAADALVTAERSRLIVRFVDRTSLTLGGNSRAVVQEVDESAARFALQVASGVFRMITGLIGKSNPGNVRVETPVATIGIRGTHFGGEIDADSARIVLLPLDEGQANAITVSNAFGAVDVDAAGYGTEIADRQSAPSPPRRMRIAAIEALTRRSVRPPGLR